MTSSPVNTFLEDKRYPTDLLLVIGCTFISAFGIILSKEGSVIRVILGIPLLTFFPGYSLTAVLWPARKGILSSKGSPLGMLSGGLDTFERLILSVGLSIVLVPIIGLILNYTSSITLGPILISLMCVTVICSIFAWILRNKLPIGDRFIVSFTANLKTPSTEGSHSERILAIVLTSCIIFSAGLVLYMIANPTDDAPHTNFYLLDQNHEIENLPKYLSINETGNVIVGIVNHEEGMVNYSLIASIDNGTFPMIYNPTSPIDMDAHGNSMMNVTLANDSGFEQEYLFHFTTEGRYRISWQLLIEGQPTDYVLHLWIDVSQDV